MAPCTHTQCCSCFMSLSSSEDYRRSCAGALAGSDKLPMDNEITNHPPSCLCQDQAYALEQATGGLAMQIHKKLVPEARAWTLP